MYLLTDSDGWDTSRKVVRQTDSTLKASVIHARLGKALGRLLARWVELDLERRDADDALVDANARVAWLDVVVDAALARFVAQVIADYGGTRDHKTFRAIFPDAPNEIIRLGLESEVETLTALADEVADAKLSKPTLALWKDVTDLFPAPPPPRSRPATSRRSRSPASASSSAAGRTTPTAPAARSRSPSTSTPSTTGSAANTPPRSSPDARRSRRSAPRSRPPPPTRR